MKVKVVTEIEVPEHYINTVAAAFKQQASYLFDGQYDRFDEGLCTRTAAIAVAALMQAGQLNRYKVDND